jgi:hypothetical protein
MTKYFTSRSDVPILVLSIFALLAAAVLSMASISSQPDKAKVDLSGDPYLAAESAAKSGVEAARWHIICHSRSQAGGLGTKYDINGATYKVEWGDFNPSDSTIKVKSTGESKLPTNASYTYTLESKIKIDYMPSHKSDIMTQYYDRNGVRQIVAR